MYEGFDPEVKSEYILISGLNNSNEKEFYDSYNDSRIEKENKNESPNKSEKVIEAEVKEEIKGNTNDSKEEYIQMSYEINKEKEKELESKFKQLKLKIIFDSVPGILRDGKFITISQGNCIIYDNRFFNKLYEIKLDNNYVYTSVIQLDNQDLFLFSEETLIIYRLKNNKFVRVQTIKDNKVGHPKQFIHSGCTHRYLKSYCPEFIKEISGNRFILVSNYGYKIYSLNEKNKYAITLIEEYRDDLETIIEIDKNNFIFLSQIECGGIRGLEYNKLVIDKITLKEISQSEKNKKLEEIKQRNYYNADHYYFIISKDKKRIKKFNKRKIKKKLKYVKYTHIKKQFLEYSTSCSHHYFNGNVILKNQYFIVLIDNNILLFDISSGIQLKRYVINLYGDYIYNYVLNIMKWNNNKDNEFILTLNGNIILFELMDEFKLKIISQIYSKNVKYLKKLNENSNKFYDDSEISYRDKNENKINGVSIFY